MTDGRIDGHFIINQDLSTSIKDELGLSADEIKQIGNIWQQVLDEANNSLHTEKTNTQNQQNNTTFSAGTIVKLTKDSWNKIITLVNSALKSIGGREIKAEEPDSFNDNVNLGEATIAKFNQENPNAESSTYCTDLAEYLKTYGNNKEKLNELKNNPLFADLAKSLEDYQNGTITIEQLEQKAEMLCEEKNNTDINCGDRARKLQEDYEQQGIGCEIISLADIDNSYIKEDEDGKYLYMERPEHGFCVIGLDENADTSDPSTWGENAVIVDAWLGKTFSVQDGINYYKEFFRYNNDIDENGNNKEHKMHFGTLEQIHEKLRQKETTVL